MIFCEITDGVVTNRAVFEGGMPSDWPNRSAWIASDEAQIGWDHDGTGFIAPPLPELAPIDLPAYAAAKRWEVETGGTNVGGFPVQTDDRSKIMIIGARVKADADPAFTTQWKTPGGFVTIDAATIIAISNAVLAHVDACFAVEGVVQAEIEAGTITTTAGIDAAAWPA